MAYWQGVAARVSVPSIVLLVVGAVLCFGAHRLAPRVFKDGEKMILPVKVTGLFLAVIGALFALL